MKYPAPTDLPKPLSHPPSAKGERYYHPELDALRFTAFLLVFLTHAGPAFASAYPFMPVISFAGAFGVPLFFALSSFLITELLLREIDRTGTIRLGAFFIRRILRIWPLYFFFLLIGITVLRVLGNQMSWGFIASYFSLSANWYYALIAVPTFFISPLWSISIEEQFYVIWSTFARIFGRSGLIVLAVVSWLLFLPVLAFLGRVSFLRAWFDSFVQFQFFGLGALLAICIHSRVLNPGRVVRAALIVAGTLLLYAAAFYMNSRPDGFRSFAPGLLLIQLGCLSLLLGVYDSREPGGLLKYPFRAAVWLGRVSYGLYVYHLFALQVTNSVFQRFQSAGGLLSVRLLIGQNVVALTATIVLAALSYRYVESPFLRLKSRFTIIRSREVSLRYQDQ